MSSGENFRLAIATRGFRGGGLGTRYVVQEIGIDENHEVVNINTTIQAISVDAKIEAVNVVSASIEVS